jgi:hypothetical protein
MIVQQIMGTVYNILLHHKIINVFVLGDILDMKDKSDTLYKAAGLLIGIATSLLTMYLLSI